MIKHLLLTSFVSVLLTLGVSAHPTSVIVPHGTDTTVPTTLPSDSPPAERRTASPVTIFTAAKILTLDPMHPVVSAVAVQDGRILAVGTLEEVKGWAQDAPVTVDDRFAGEVILPGFIEAHMHPQLTGILWEGVYVGRFDRYTPDGKFEKGLVSKKEVVDKIAARAKALGDNDKWMIAWGYQPEFYNNAPLTVDDLDPVTGKHPILIENASMHIYYINSNAIKVGGFTPQNAAAGVVVKDGKLTGEFQEAQAIMGLLPQLPKLDDKALLKATWSAAKLAHQVGVTSVGDASFGSIPGGYKAYRTAVDSPDFPVRVTLYPLLETIRSKQFAERGGLDYVKKIMAGNDDRLAIGAVKFLADGSVQGLTANLMWPYYRSGENGVANMSFADLEEWVGKVHQAGMQCMIHTNGDQATEWAIRAIQKAQDAHPRFDHRHHLDHNQMVTDNQLQRMAALGICTNLFVNHVHFWGDIHTVLLGANRAARINPTASARRHNVRFSSHSDASVTRLDPLMSVWVAATRKTMSGKVLGPAERISVEDALRMVTIDAAYLMHQDDIKGTITEGKLADFTVLAKNPLEVPVDEVKDIRVKATVLGGKVFPVTYKD